MPCATLLERCTKKGRIELATVHFDYATVLANLLDGMAWAEFSPSKLADRLDAVRTGRAPSATVPSPGDRFAEQSSTAVCGTCFATLTCTCRVVPLVFFGWVVDLKLFG